MAFLFLFSTFIELGLKTGSEFSPKKTEPLYVAFLYFFFYKPFEAWPSVGARGHYFMVN